MASNEPGWGNRNNDGPPDLDEILRQFSKKLNGLFGKGKGGQNGSGKGDRPDTPEFTTIGFLPILGLIAIVWLGSGFYIVDQGSRGVVLRFGKHVETTMPGPRWHVPYPIESASVINMEQVRTIEVGYRTLGEAGTGRNKELRESLMLTDDENIIDLQFAVQYQLKSVEDFAFNNRYNEGAARGTMEKDAVRGVAETAIREIVGHSRMDFALYEGREDIAVRARKLMQEVLDRYQSGISIVTVTMQNAQPPEQVQAAFDDAVKAGQDMERQKNEGQAYANDVIPKARGAAARLIEEASGYKQRVINEAQGNASRFTQILTEYNKAPEVTRQRLFIEAQEQVLSSVGKVVIDQKQGNSLLYLPIDKLMAGATAPVSGQATPVPASIAPATADTQRSREAFRSRERENRP